jgi:hypothetical protein
MHFKNRILLILAGLAVLLLLAACAPQASPTVAQGQVVVRLNDKYDPRTAELASKYTIVATEGQAYNSAATDKNPLDQTVKYAVVGPTQDANGKNVPQVGIYGNEVLPPGPYKNIPEAEVRLVPAAVVDPGWVGVYMNAEVNPPEYKILNPGVTNYPKDKVVFYPSTLVRYRTLNSAVLSDSQSNGDAKGQCSSIRCETTIDNVNLTGTQVTGFVDLDINFSFLTEQKYAARLRELGSPDNAIQNYISKIRGIVRTQTSYTPTQLQTAESRQALEALYLTQLQKAVEGQPIRVESVILRSVLVGSEEYRKAIEAAELQIDQQKKKNEQLSLEADNLTAEQDLQKKKNDFVRAEALADAQNKAKAIDIIMAPLKGLPWQTVAIMFDYLKINPAVNLDGSSTGPQVTTTPAP